MSGSNIKDTTIEISTWKRLISFRMQQSERALLFSMSSFPRQRTKFFRDHLGLAVLSLQRQQHQIDVETIKHLLSLEPNIDDLICCRNSLALLADAVEAQYKPLFQQLCDLVQDYSFVSLKNFTSKPIAAQGARRSDRVRVDRYSAEDVRNLLIQEDERRLKGELDLKAEIDSASEEEDSQVEESVDEKDDGFDEDDVENGIDLVPAGSDMRTAQGGMELIQEDLDNNSKEVEEHVDADEIDDDEEEYEDLSFIVATPSRKRRRSETYKSSDSDSEGEYHQSESEIESESDVSDPPTDPETSESESDDDLADEEAESDDDFTDVPQPAKRQKILTLSVTMSEMVTAVAAENTAAVAAVPPTAETAINCWFTAYFQSVDDPSATVGARVVYNHYKEWAINMGISPVPIQQFPELMKTTVKIGHKRKSDGNVYVGLKMKPTSISSA